MKPVGNGVMIDRSHLYLGVMEEEAPAKPMGSGAMTLVDEILVVLYLLGLVSHNGPLRLQWAMAVTKTSVLSLIIKPPGRRPPFATSHVSVPPSSHQRAKE